MECAGTSSTRMRCCNAEKGKNALRSRQATFSPHAESRRERSVAATRFDSPGVTVTLPPTPPLLIQPAKEIMVPLLIPPVTE
eukprot:6214803-Pleurochrysis_carterae.AAC.4